MANSTAQAQSFEGITIIELANLTAENSIRGFADRGADGPSPGQYHPFDSGRYILTFVSSQGSYAALLGEKERGCVAWAAPGDTAGRSIAFGVPPTTASLMQVPRICQPFRLTYEAAGRIRVETNNKYSEHGGPLGHDAKLLEHNQVHPVVVRIPLDALDWNTPAFSRHDTKGVRLGPLPVVEASLKNRATVRLGPVRRSPVGIQGRFEANLPAQAGQHIPPTVHGFVAAGENVGAPANVLYVTWYAERLSESSTLAAFEAAIAERYGVAIKRPNNPPWQKVLMWLYDLKGRPLTEGDAAPENCLALTEPWLAQSSLLSFGDIGPWGCALIVRFTHNGAQSRVVDEYRIEALSGYTAAINHFSMRLVELKDAREKFETLTRTKPKL